MLNNKSVIDAIYIIASYTYGPLLGMFAFGLFTRRQTNDRRVPLTAVASPLLCYVLDWWIFKETGYKFGYELLMLNGNAESAIKTGAPEFIINNGRVYYKRRNSLL